MSGTTSELFGVACKDAQACWVVGAGGTILATADGGSTWIAQNSGTLQKLSGVSCPTGTCWAVGDAGTIVSAKAPANTTVPSVTGEPVNGQTLSASTGGWTGSPSISYSYQWHRCDPTCHDVASEQSQTYRLTASDVGATIRVAVTARNLEGSVQAVSAQTSVVGSAPENVTSPVISGVPRFGNTLTASVGTWSYNPFSYSYQWLRDDAPIANATTGSYATDAADVARRLKVRVTATNSVGSASADSSEVVVSGAPVNDAAPTITGTSRSGQTLTGSDGSWRADPPATMTRQWRRCDPVGTNCIDIPGATAASYGLVDADAGKALRYRNQAANSYGSATADSAPTNVVVGPPDTSITARPSDPSSSSSATFDFQSAPSGASFECRQHAATATPPAWSACGAPKSFSGLADDTYTFEVRARDAELVDSTPASVTWKLDTTAPALSLTGPTGAVNTATPLFFGDAGGADGSAPTATADGAVVSLKIYPGTVATGTPVRSFGVQRSATAWALSAGAWGSANPSLPDGTYTVTATQADAVGNVTTVSKPLFIDTQTPDTTVTLGPAPTTSSSGATFEFVASETPSTFECNFDSGGWTACSSPTSYSSLADGSHSFSVRAIDQAGNVDQSPDTRSWSIDSTPPETSIESGPAGTVADTTAAFGFSSPEGGVSFECRLDGAAWEACSSPQTYTNVPNGSHEFDVRAIDMVGNLDASPATRAWIVDTVPPGPPVITSHPADPANVRSADFAFEPAESRGLLECALDGDAFAACATGTSMHYDGLANGTHTFHVRQRDDAGNTSAAADFTWLIDIQPPTNAVAPELSGWAQGGARLRASTGTWTGTAPIGYAYQWRSCDVAGVNCSDISGATTSAYELTSTDVGRTVRVAVTASNGAGSATMESAPSDTVAGGALLTNSECMEHELPDNDDGSTAEVALPFTINFDGPTFDHLWVNNNGTVTLDSSDRTYTPYDLTSATRPIIAPFFADVDTRGVGSNTVKYGYGETTYEGHPALCVNWIDVGYYSQHTDKLNSFQLLLVDRSDLAPREFDIVFNYGSIEWETGDASGGVNGFGGTPARVGFSNGDGAAAHSLELPGSGTSHALLDFGPDALVRGSRGSDIAGRYIFQIRDHDAPQPAGGDLLADVGVDDLDDPFDTGAFYPDARDSYAIPYSLIDSGSGVDELWITNDSGAEVGRLDLACGDDCSSEKAGTIPIDGSQFAEGLHQLTLHARDRVGNESSSVFTVGIDRTAPSPPTDFRVVALDTFTASATVEWDPAEDPDLPDGSNPAGTSVIEYRIARGASWSSWDTTAADALDLTNVTPGEPVTIEAHSVDQAGNAGPTETRSLFIVPPADEPNTSPSGGSNTVALTAAFSDPQLGLVARGGYKTVLSDSAGNEYPTTTGPDGVAQFRDVPDGQYTLSSGYELAPEVTILNVSGGETRTIAVTSVSPGDLTGAEKAFCATHLVVCGYFWNDRDKAFNYAGRLFTGDRKDSDSTKANAFQHSYWVALMVNSIVQTWIPGYGYEDTPLADEYATAHESDQLNGNIGDQRHSKMDRHNNDVGYDWARFNSSNGHKHNDFFYCNTLRNRVKTGLKTRTRGHNSLTFRPEPAIGQLVWLKYNTQPPKDANGDPIRPSVRVNLLRRDQFANGEPCKG